MQREIPAPGGEPLTTIPPKKKTLTIKYCHHRILTDIKILQSLKIRKS